MGHGPAEVFSGDDLAGDRLDDLGAGDEHLRGLVDHEDEIGEGRGIDGAAGAGPHDRRDLGNDAGIDGVAVEDVAVAGEGVDRLLDTGPARVVEADDRRTDLDRRIHRLDDLSGMHLAEGTAGDREILREGIDQPAVDHAVAGDHGFAFEVEFVHAESGASVFDEGIEFDEGIGIEQVLEALPGGHLALGMLLVDPLLAAAEGDPCFFLAQKLSLYLSTYLWLPHFNRVII